MDREVSLRVDGETIRMNGFVQRSLASVIEGFLKALDDVPLPASRIEIAIEAKRQDS